MTVYQWAIVDKKTGEFLLEEYGIWSRGAVKLFAAEDTAKSICGKRGKVVKVEVRRIDAKDRT